MKPMASAVSKQASVSRDERREPTNEIENDGIDLERHGDFLLSSLLEDLKGRAGARRLGQGSERSERPRVCARLRP